VKCHVILFVQDQASATAFFSEVLQRRPDLVQPGMSEFVLGQDWVLGLMPRAGIQGLLGLDAAELGPCMTGEVYVYVDTPHDHHLRALQAGALELSPLGGRDWGDEAAYSRTPDGHVLAFARSLR
jgi:hypothetical protein